MTPIYEMEFSPFARLAPKIAFAKLLNLLYYTKWNFRMLKYKIEVSTDLTRVNLPLKESSPTIYWILPWLAKQSGSKFASHSTVNDGYSQRSTNIIHDHERAESHDPIKYIIDQIPLLSSSKISQVLFSCARATNLAKETSVITLEAHKILLKIDKCRKVPWKQVFLMIIRNIKFLVITTLQINLIYTPRFQN